MNVALLFLAFTVGGPDEDARAALAFAQSALKVTIPEEEKPIDLPVVPKKPKFASYDEARSLAIKNKSPFIVFVDTTPRAIEGATVTTKDSYPGHKGSYIVVALPHPDRAIGLEWLETLNEFAEDSEIQTAIAAAKRKQVSRLADPFYSPGSGRSTADGDRIISRAEINWPKAVPLAPTAKFYSFERKYQKMYTMNNGTYKGNDLSALNEQPEGLTHSGGLPSNWKSTKALAIPQGKHIRVWQENEDVRAFSLVPRNRWSFPVGTVAYDVLSDAKGKVQEVRVSTKEADGWDHGDVWREVDGKWQISRSPLLNQSCASCHKFAGGLADVPGRIYRAAIWGDDGRFSFRPYGDSGWFDKDWPIASK